VSASADTGQSASISLLVREIGLSESVESLTVGICDLADGLGGVIPATAIRLGPHPSSVPPGGHAEVPIVIEVPRTATAGDYRGMIAVGSSITYAEIPMTLRVATPSRRLTVEMAGSCTGTVSSEPAGLDCGSLCSFDVPEGTQVSLRARPDDGCLFMGFGGDPDCDDGVLSMTADRACTATFRSAYGLRVERSGTAGGVTSRPAGIDCGGTCEALFEEDTAVTLTASPQPGSRFLRWSADCQGTTPACQLVMAGDRLARAEFGAVPLSISLKVPSQAKVGKKVSLSMSVKNTDSVNRIVTPLPLVITSTGGVASLQRISGPTPASKTIKPNKTATFKWSLKAIDTGTATISAGAVSNGEQSTLRSVNVSVSK
jgi:hypothetical protein